MKEITLLFFSFNPNGLQKIPIGIIGADKEFNINEYKDSYFSYLKIKQYDLVGDCIGDLKNHKQYLCLEILPQNPVIVNVLYDNTQNVVIWEILDRIKMSVDYLQKQKSKETEI